MHKRCDIVKVDESLGLVFGYAIVCKVGGEDYYDLQGDHISEKEMLKAVTEFMKNSRVAKEMHQGEQIGEVVHSFPLTEQIADSLGIVADRYGWLIAMQPSADVFAKFASGELTGFSIGGGARAEAA
jgi:hypothetical protein